MTFKPVFVGWITLVMQLPIQIFAALWAGGFIGGLFREFFQKDIFLEIGVFVFVLVPTIFYFAKKWNYERTEYKFLDDHLEFDEGFFTINRKMIKYKDVKEVTLRKGILQRIYGLGTIYLGTYATGSYGRNPFSAFGFGNISASGINVRDIENPDEAFEKIKRLIDRFNV